MPELINHRHEAIARDVAGGVSVLSACRAVGMRSRAATKIAKRPEVAARIAELRAEFAKGSSLQRAWIEQELLTIARSDPADYLEPRSAYTDKLRVKSIEKLTREQRAAVSEFTFDRNGNLQVKLHDRAAALGKLLEITSPTKVELTGANGGPVEVDVATLEPTERIRVICFDAATALQELAETHRMRLAQGLADLARPLVSTTAADDADDAPPVERARRLVADVRLGARRLADDDEAMATLRSELAQIVAALPADPMSLEASA
jgi:hypothetical protein